MNKWFRGVLSISIYLTVYRKSKRNETIKFGDLQAIVTLCFTLQSKANNTRLWTTFFRAHITRTEDVEEEEKIKKIITANCATSFECNSSLSCKWNLYNYVKFFGILTSIISGSRKKALIFVFFSLLSRWINHSK